MLDEWYLVFCLLHIIQTGIIYLGKPGLVCECAKATFLTENVNSWNQTKNRYGRNPNQAQVLAPDHVILTISFPFAAREETYPQNPAEAPHRMMRGKNLNCPPSLFEAKWNVSRTMDSRDAAAAGEPQILSSALVMALFFDCWTE
ncbi:hypothetical protein TNIN_330991 [Trichonephila inaurata madagascariensis]|uniref:Uncharacterized protein n=1 Tax=Trichonephila inaurata madagascariensis TaxID=2747483 RepID=A0A8X6KK06_9ARAC|nr:hypothetical protein TNIN_330991 [Trichonephila inaurata madagascariensis]